MFNAAVCKIQASKRYVESLPIVLKDKRSCFSQGERLAVQLPLDRMRSPERALTGETSLHVGQRMGAYLSAFALNHEMSAYVMFTPTRYPQGK